MKRIQKVHPFLFAIYFVVGIYSQNASQVPLHWLYRPLVILLLLAIAIYLLLLKRFSDRAYAGWATTLLLVWFFSGHVYRLLLGLSLFWQSAFGGVLAVIIVTLPVGLLASRYVWGRITGKQAMTTFLNGTSLVLVIFSLWNIVSLLRRSVAQIQMI